MPLFQPLLFLATNITANMAPKPMQKLGRATLHRSGSTTKAVNNPAMPNAIKRFPPIK
jgi:hypothetical protein